MLEGSSSSHAAIPTGWCSPARGSHTGRAPGNSFFVLRSRARLLPLGPRSPLGHRAIGSCPVPFPVAGPVLGVPMGSLRCSAASEWTRSWCREGTPSRACLLPTTAPARTVQVLLPTQSTPRSDWHWSGHQFIGDGVLAIARHQEGSEPPGAVHHRVRKAEVSEKGSRCYRPGPKSRQSFGRLLQSFSSPLDLALCKSGVVSSDRLNIVSISPR